MTIPEFKPIAWTNKQGDYFEAVRKDTVFGSHTRPLYTSDQLAEAYEAGKREQAAELAAEQAKNAALRDALNRLQEACNGEDDNEFYAANSAATKYLSAPSDTSALEVMIAKAGEKMREKCVSWLVDNALKQSRDARFRSGIVIAAGEIRATIASVKSDQFRDATKMTDETSAPAIVFYPAGSLGEEVYSEGGLA